MKVFKKLDISKLRVLKVDILREELENKAGLSAANIKDFKFDINYHIGFNPDHKLVKTELQISISAETADPNIKATCTYLFAFIYLVENFTDLVHIDNEQIIESRELGLSLTNITVSTSRGILIERLQGTVFRNFILPILMPGIFEDAENAPKNR